ncbi:MAG: hypothetical protein AB7I04_13690 [Pseudomonadales bacterium]
MNAVTVADLPRLTAAAAVPFEFIVPSASGETRWVCLEVLRVLPGRRLVVRARRSPETGDVILKLFYGRGHRRYCRRERQGLDRLAAAGLPVPARLEALDGPRLSGLVLEYLPDASAIADADQGALERVAEYFGRLHAAGYRQTDQHLGNFVRCRGDVFTVDGDGVRKRRRLAGRRGDLDNLALLAAQRSPSRDEGLEELLAAYARGRGAAPPDAAAFRARLLRARQGRMRRYLAKTLRDCTEFAVRRRPERVTYAVRGVGERLLGSLFGRPLDPSATAFLPGEVLKAGNSATVLRLREEAPVVVKRYNVKNVRHGLRRMLRPHPRYRRAWRFGQLLALLDIPTARPLVLVEERRLLWRGVAYLVQSDLPGMDLQAEVGLEGLSEARLLEVTALFAMLRSAGLCHGDTKASNFIVYQDRVHLIDLDAMRMAARGFEDDVARFLDNWSGPERRRFEAAFRQAGLL